MDLACFRMMMGAAATKRVGQMAWTTPGTYQFVVPMSVTSISPVCIDGGWSGGDKNSNGAGYGGKGGNLRYRESILVTPGEILTVVVGAGGITVPNSFGTQPGGTSALLRDGVVILAGYTAIGGDVGGGDGGGGGAAGTSTTYGGGGGGAGGYSGNGGTGLQSGAGGAGGGGINGSGSTPGGAGGGGVGIFGEGASGLGGTSSSRGGKGGSGGTDGGTPTLSTPGLYGAGGGGRGTSNTDTGSRSGGGGAVRIIWGFGRAYPSTRTADEFP